jgi:hypothetical protein
LQAGQGRIARPPAFSTGCGGTGSCRR